MARTRLYQVWAEMKYRCAKRPAYAGKGIKVCAEWQSFEPFRDWALANGYEERKKRTLQIDRIDNDGHYQPSNCRWVDNVGNMNNRGCTVFLTAFGETKSAGEWSRDPRCVVKHSTLRHRVTGYGWAAEAALTTPVLRKRSTCR